MFIVIWLLCFQIDCCLANMLVGHIITLGSYGRCKWFPTTGGPAELSKAATGGPPLSLALSSGFCQLLVSSSCLALDSQYWQAMAVHLA